MMITAQGLKDLIISRTQSLDTPSGALAAVSGAINDYLNQNILVTFSWTAVAPNGQSDPVTTATGMVSGILVNLTPSNLSEASQVKTWFDTAIGVGIKLGTYTITDAGFAVSPGTMLDLPPLDLSRQGNSREDAILVLAQSIVDAVKAYVPAVPVAGTHGAFTGTGSVVSLT